MVELKFNKRKCSNKPWDLEYQVYKVLLFTFIFNFKDLFPSLRSWLTYLLSISSLLVEFLYFWQKIRDLIFWSLYIKQKDNSLWNHGLNSLGGAGITCLNRKSAVRRMWIRRFRTKPSDWITGACLFNIAHGWPPLLVKFFVILYKLK